MTSDHENRGGLEEMPFSFRQIGQDKVLIYWHGRQVTILKGSKARSFLVRVSEGDDRQKQLVMAKITGNFKRGNEKEF